MNVSEVDRQQVRMIQTPRRPNLLLETPQPVWIG